MLRYIGNRILSTVPVLFVVSLVVFSLLHLLPGDPAEALIPSEDLRVTAEERAELVAAVRARYDLDRPLPVQYGRWLSRAVRGDLGRSIRTREPVAAMITARLPVTAQLSVLSLGIAVLIALPVGVLAAVRRNSPLDLGITTLAMAGVAVPSFYLGMLLILLFTHELHWLPAPGSYVPLWEDPVHSIKLIVLPAASLGLISAAVLTRLVRSSLLEVLAQDYMRTARAKGLRGRAVVLRHGLRNALLPVVTVLGLQFIHLLGGTVIVEQIFALPGLGRMVVNAIRASDFPVVQGFVLFIGVVVVAGNLIVDLIYAVLDPRIRYAG
jgi:peptide/nickel transport system permease protein